MAAFLKSRIPLFKIFQVLAYTVGCLLLILCSMLYIESKAIVFRFNHHAIANGIYHFRYYPSIDLSNADMPRSTRMMDDFSRGRTMIAFPIISNVRGPLAFGGSISISLWWFIAPSILLALRSLRIHQVNQMRKRTNCCLQCGYSLILLQSETCPECGESIRMKTP